MIRALLASLLLCCSGLVGAVTCTGGDVDWIVLPGSYNYVGVSYYGAGENICSVITADLALDSCVMAGDGATATGTGYGTLTWTVGRNNPGTCDGDPPPAGTGNADVALYLGQCFLALALGWCGGLVQRHFQKLSESMSSLG